MPKLVVSDKGEAKEKLEVKGVTLADFQGHALMIHAGGDNYSDAPKPLGGGGERIVVRRREVDADGGVYAWRTLPRSRGVGTDKEERAMATALLFIGWDRPVAGKEKEAWKYFMEEGDAALDQVPEAGILRARRTGRAHAAQRDLNGFVLLFGERAKLDELRRTDEFERFSISLGMLFEATASSPASTTKACRRRWAA